MFEAKTYINRRKQLKEKVQSGLILILGHDESPMNYLDNPYYFRQNSSFLYFFGLDDPGLAGVIDIDNNREIIFGYDFTVDDIVWMGPQPGITERAKKAGVDQTMAPEKLEEIIKNAMQKGQQLHYLPQYRGDNLIKIENVSGIRHSEVNDKASKELIKAVVALRSIKSDEEIEEIEDALDISYKMNRLAMKMSKPGVYEKEVVGALEGLVMSKGNHISFPIIFSIHGEVLHNHSHENEMNEGDILVLDSGAESALHYASDITRTIPASKKFTDIQKDIYNIVLAAQEGAIGKMEPGISFKDVHLHSATIIADGLQQLGFMKGNTDDAVAAGAHALFFPHGLGHPMGLDVHDMEDLGEKYVGYDDKTQRSEQFGLAFLRFAKKLVPGHVLTVEPGIYFIPELFEQWKSEKKLAEFIDYDRVEKNVDFGGIRIEDDVLITKDGHRVLGKPIPKKVEDVEALKE